MKEYIRLISLMSSLLFLIIKNKIMRIFKISLILGKTKKNPGAGSTGTK
jgi:hypothetical protein